VNVWIKRCLRYATGWLLALVLLAPLPAAAQELLLNRSFESPVTPTPVNGNNFYATNPNWTATSVTPAQTNPFNLIRPHAGYAGNPTATPTGGGALYMDVNSASGVLVQSVTVPSAGMIDISGWFSVRDTPQALTGLTVRVRNSSNVIVATASTSFVATDPIGLWKQANATNVPIAAGTYTFEIVLPNPANTDLASMVFKPSLTVTKTSTTFSDSLSLSNPKSIPGSVAEYTISATSPASYTVTSNSLLITDATPANMALVVNNIGGAGSGPAAFTAGATGLTYTFTSLASATDDIEFSNNGGASWTYVPVADANGTDSTVTTVRLRPKGTMAASSTFSFRLRYRLN
jgi:hypothetical protein